MFRLTDVFSTLRSIFAIFRLTDVFSTLRFTNMVVKLIVMSLFIPQGVPVLILANKQDLPGAREPKQIEKLLGLHELSPIGPQPIHPNISSNCASSTTQYSNSSAANSRNSTMSEGTSNASGSAADATDGDGDRTNASGMTSTNNSNTSNAISSTHPQPMKGWFIQPACAITGEGLHEGLEALYDMIIKKRKLNKSHRKKR